MSYISHVGCCTAPSGIVVFIIPRSVCVCVCAGLRVERRASWNSLLGCVCVCVMQPDFTVGPKVL